MTFKGLKDDAQNIVFWSNVYPGDDPVIINLLIDLTTIPTIVKSRQEILADADIISTVPSTIPDGDSYQNTSMCLSSTLLTSLGDLSS